MHIVQQRENGCVLACIAMLTNISLDAVYEVYPEFNGNGVSTEDTLLILKRLGYDPVQYVQPKCFPKRSYIVTAPSLNKPGHNHAVVISNLHVYDPNNGTGKKYYTTDTLFSWSEVIELVME